MTSVDICNLALGYLGDAAAVTSIAPPDGSVQALHCSRFYPLAVNVLLEMHDWGFTTTRAQLVAVQECYDNWAFAYGMPSNSSQIISVIPACEYDLCQDVLSCGYDSYQDYSWPYWDGWARPFELQRLCDFQIETNPDGVLVILSNAENAICRYTTSLYSELSFPAQFSDALAWRLAAMLAGPIIKGEAGAQQAAICMKMFGSVIADAKVQDANQQRGGRRPQPVWTRDR